MVRNPEEIGFCVEAQICDDIDYGAEIQEETMNHVIRKRI